MRSGCPYCWGLGEFYCIDPDTFNDLRGSNTTCPERILRATQGPKALGCGYNENGIDHFNWPTLDEIIQSYPSTEKDNYSMGSKPFDTSQYKGDNYSKFWYNSKPGIDAAASDFDNKLPSDRDKNGDIPCDAESNWNFGAMGMKSLNEIELAQSDAYYFRVEINSIPWLKL